MCQFETARSQGANSLTTITGQPQESEASHHRGATALLSREALLDKPMRKASAPPNDGAIHHFFESH
ncbi:MAG: hypothetical protein EBS61_04590, partial [Betaproteobacteria bacterium]|nr:hypothetical protein [Betaproteobacteria bacterium]